MEVVEHPCDVAIARGAVVSATLRLSPAYFAVLAAAWTRATSDSSSSSGGSSGSGSSGSAVAPCAAGVAMSGSGIDVVDDGSGGSGSSSSSSSSSNRDESDAAAAAALPHNTIGCAVRLANGAPLHWWDAEAACYRAVSILQPAYRFAMHPPTCTVRVSVPAFLLPPSLYQGGAQYVMAFAAVHDGVVVARAATLPFLVLCASEQHAAAASAAAAACHGVCNAVELVSAVAASLAYPAPQTFAAALQRAAHARARAAAADNAARIAARKQRRPAATLSNVTLCAVSLPPSSTAGGCGATVSGCVRPRPLLSLRSGVADDDDTDDGGSAVDVVGSDDDVVGSGDDDGDDGNGGGSSSALCGASGRRCRLARRHAHVEVPTPHRRTRVRVTPPLDALSLPSILPPLPPPPQVAPSPPRLQRQRPSLAAAPAAGGESLLPPPLPLSQQQQQLRTLRAAGGSRGRSLSCASCASCCTTLGDGACSGGGGDSGSAPPLLSLQRLSPTSAATVRMFVAGAASARDADASPLPLVQWSPC